MQENVRKHALVVVKMSDLAASFQIAHFVANIYHYVYERHMKACIVSDACCSLFSPPSIVFEAARVEVSDPGQMIHKTTMRGMGGNYLQKRVRSS